MRDDRPSHTRLRSNAENSVTWSAVDAALLDAIARYTALRGDIIPDLPVLDSLDGLLAGVRVVQSRLRDLSAHASATPELAADPRLTVLAGAAYRFACTIVEDLSDLAEETVYEEAQDWLLSLRSIAEYCALYDVAHVAPRFEAVASLAARDARLGVILGRARAAIDVLVSSMRHAVRSHAA